MSKIVRKSIAFNIDDPLQREMLEYISKYKNFSFYGKSLIQKDMRGDFNRDVQIEEFSDGVEINSELAKSFL